MADSKLASEIASHVARMIHSQLDEISKAVAQDVGQVSFSTTATFKRDKDGNLLCAIQPRKRIPMEPAELKLTQVAGQLSLFEAEPVDGE